MENNVLPADLFVVVNKSVISNYDTKVLIMLYQPLVGTIAISLYHNLYNYLDRQELISIEASHSILFKSMNISVQEFNDARIKLEAIGLIKTYQKKGNLNSYVYEIYSPLSASEFINNPLLSTSLYTTIGSVAYDDIVNLFKIVDFDKSDYQEITTKFSDVFMLTNSIVNDDIIDNLKGKKTEKIRLENSIDIPSILALIPDEQLVKRSVNKSVKELIYKIAFTYNYDDTDMVELIKSSLNENHRIDINLLKENANKYYSFENMGKLPSIIYRNHPEFLRSKNKDGSVRSKAISEFENLSPYDFLRSKYNDAMPTASDLSIIIYLLDDLNLKSGVVNVLIDYVLKINNNKLTKNFVSAIGAQWSKSKIETVEDAMKLAFHEYHKTIDKKSNTKTIKKTAEWIDKQISIDEASSDEIAALEARLNRK